MRARDGILAEICSDGRGRYSGAREAEEGDGTARWARPVSETRRGAGLTGPSGAREEWVTRGERGSGGTAAGLADARGAGPRWSRGAGVGR